MKLTTYQQSWHVSISRKVLAGATAVALTLVGFGLTGGQHAALAAPGGDEESDVPSEADVPDPDLPDDARVLTEEEALVRDATALAEEEGVPVEVMQERLQFQAAVDQLRESWPSEVRSGSYAGGRMSHSPTAPGAVLYFKGAVPTAVRSQLVESGLTGVDLQGGQKYSWSELVARKNALHDAVVGLGFQNVFSTVNVDSQQVLVEVVLQADRPGLRGSALRERITSAVAELPAGEGDAVGADELEIIERPAGSSVIELSHGYGGAGLRDDGNFECTSGFVVRRSSDWLEGVLTAAHCEGINQLEQNNSSGGVDLTFSAPFQDETIGSYGDLEWHSTTHDDFPEFWSNDCCRRTVSGRIANSGIDVDDYVCHYGRAGGYDCGTVSDADSSASFYWSYCDCTISAYNLVDVDGATGVGGDSGGPWFLTSVAYGIHHGERISNGDMVFSKIQNAESAFGVFVQTG